MSTVFSYFGRGGSSATPFGLFYPTHHEAEVLDWILKLKVVKDVWRTRIEEGRRRWISHQSTLKKYENLFKNISVYILSLCHRLLKRYTIPNGDHACRVEGNHLDGLLCHLSREARRTVRACGTEPPPERRIDVKHNELRKVHEKLEDAGAEAGARLLFGQGVQHSVYSILL